MLWSTGVQYFHNGRKDLAAKMFERGIAMATKDIAALEKTKPSDPGLGDLYSELVALDI
jgi:hypothetical protein